MEDLFQISRHFKPKPPSFLGKQKYLNFKRKVMASESKSYDTKGAHLERWKS
jgi:hypothetical protein